jgi:hypothetical protein
MVAALDQFEHVFRDWAWLDWLEEEAFSTLWPGSDRTVAPLPTTCVGAVMLSHMAQVQGWTPSLCRLATSAALRTVRPRAI